MLLETARRYNHETECITFLKDFTYSKDDFHRAGVVGRGLGGGGAGPLPLGRGLGGCRASAPAGPLLVADLRPSRSCLSLYFFTSKVE